MTMNMDIILIAVTLVALVVILAITALSGGFQSSSKETRAKLDRLKARFSDDGQPISDKTSIRRNQGQDGLMGAIDGLIPRREELSRRLERAGMDIDLGRFALMIAGLSVFMIFLLSAFGFPLFFAATAGLMTGIGLPSMIINMRIKGRLAKFTTQFPDAMDMMVRGLKSGLPVSECISNVGREVPAPTGIEFAKMTDQMRLGSTLEESLWDTANRLDTPDFKFFVISLSVQRETGGNLGETLANLSQILRQRQAMKLKVKALSSEAKASAWIVGLLPIIMLGLISVVNPEYASVLFTNPKAIVALVGGFIWMAIGVFVMARMTSFEV